MREVLETDELAEELFECDVTVVENQVEGESLDAKRLRSCRDARSLGPTIDESELLQRREGNQVVLYAAIPNDKLAHRPAAEHFEPSGLLEDVCESLSSFVAVDVPCYRLGDGQRPHKEGARGFRQDEVPELRQLC